MVDPGTGRDVHADEAAARATGRPVTLRLRVPDGPAGFLDGFHGEVGCDWRRDLGDFPIRMPAGHVSYQLATVSDDLAAGVTHVVRGDDLLASTPRQGLIYDALGAADRVPAYWHLPLVVGPDGRKLSKRHGSVRIADYRADGSPGRLLGLLAGWLGIEDGAGTAADLVGRFDLARVPRGPVTFVGAG